MNLCLRLPFKRRPFVALHFCRWGTRYRSCRAVSTIWKFGVGCGHAAPECGHDRCKRPVAEVGHWKWFHWDGAWR